MASIEHSPQQVQEYNIKSVLANPDFEALLQEFDRTVGIPRHIDAVISPTGEIESVVIKSQFGYNLYEQTENQ